ncbi:hypothetical protein [Sphingobium sp. CR28]|uniref:hypothetical protein n=1 Tax=Sphingobium sp. CR28 TaxID=3400272 RepID=UPI003FED5EB3
MRRRTGALLAGIALLAGCNASPETGNSATGTAAGLRDPATAGVAPGMGEAVAANATAAPEPAEMKGQLGARHVLGLWAEALERGDWATARAQWGNGGAMSGRTPAQFAAEYARYRQVKVEIGRGQADAGAGSLFFVAPVVVSGITREGEPFRGEGRAYLRRVNDVPGASAEQLRWHIERMELKEVP